MLKTIGLASPFDPTKVLAVVKIETERTDEFLSLLLSDSMIENDYEGFPSIITSLLVLKDFCYMLDEVDEINVEVIYDEYYSTAIEFNIVKTNMDPNAFFKNDGVYRIKLGDYPGEIDVLRHVAEPQGDW